MAQLITPEMLPKNVYKSTSEAKNRVLEILHGSIRLLGYGIIKQDVENTIKLISIGNRKKNRYQVNPKP
ncbi:hypothetical protein [Algoriphagus antarcticus]|uniref:hypothetical protein n=1 Tax=Algoriphagus antarcticus TaxID=238540 RepID=UPI000A37B5EC|nr:hypothetical protein [Algoriphagus antarcticus]